MQAPEAFLLLSLPNCTLSSKDLSESGILGLQCVTIPIPDASSATERDVYLVFRLNASETPIDPARTIQRSDTPVARIYTFYGTPADPNELVLTIPTPPGDPKSTYLHEDLNTFEGILEQYAVDFRSPASSSSPPRAQTRAIPDEPPPSYTSGNTDLRGHLVMIDEGTGEVVGEVEDRFRIREDPVMYEQGHERDPVFIEVPDEAGLRESDAGAMEAFARIVPPDQQDWITKSATIVSHAISLTTSLLVTTITTASNFYISKSSPSPHHSSANLAPTSTPHEKRSTSPNLRAPSPTPPPLPPRALVFLTSERTRKGLRSVHTVSGQAVRVSAKTVRTIDNMIRRAMGARTKQYPNRLGYILAAPNSLSPVPQAASPGVPYNPYPSSDTKAQYGSPSVFPPRPWTPDPKPPLPPRSGLSPYPSSPQPPALPPRNLTPSPRPISPSPPQQQHLADFPPQPRLSTTRRVLISADLILSTVGDSTRKLLDTGATNLGRVMHHKYGAEAAESSLLMAGTARNVGLVYVDMQGIGRRALLKRAGMSFVKGRVQGSEREQNKRPVPPVPGQGGQR